jgi:hypothetical protein
MISPTSQPISQDDRKKKAQTFFREGAWMVNPPGSPMTLCRGREGWTHIGLSRSGNPWGSSWETGRDDKIKHQ